MTGVRLRLERSPEQYEQALDGALEALREYWDASGSDIELIKELQSALRLAVPE